MPKLVTKLCFMAHFNVPQNLDKIIKISWNEAI